MHIPDMQLCRYHHGPLDCDSWEVPLLAVGWLEHPHTYVSGSVPSSVLGKLVSLVSQARSAFPHYYFRGTAECSICIHSGGNSPGPIWSQEYVIIPDSDVVYASPGGIVHYIEEHNYCPPHAFLEAVKTCPPLESDAYHEALFESNLAVGAPLESKQEYEARLKMEMELAVKARKENQRDGS